VVQLEQWEYLAQPAPRELSVSLVQRVLLALTALPEPPASLEFLVPLVQPGSTGQQVLLELLVSQAPLALPELRAVMVLQARQESAPLVRLA
jgi:hypothetical protein